MNCYFQLFFLGQDEFYRNGVRISRAAFFAAISGAEWDFENQVYWSNN